MWFVYDKEINIKLSCSNGWLAWCNGQRSVCKWWSRPFEQQIQQLFDVCTPKTVSSFIHMHSANDVLNVMQLSWSQLANWWTATTKENAGWRCCKAHFTRYVETYLVQSTFLMCFLFITSTIWLAFCVETIGSQAWCWGCHKTSWLTLKVIITNDTLHSHHNGFISVMHTHFTLFHHLFNHKQHEALMSYMAEHL